MMFERHPALAIDCGLPNSTPQRSMPPPSFATSSRIAEWGLVHVKRTTVPTSVFAASEVWGSGADRIKTLPDRIDRAAGELVPLMIASDRSSQVRDPFGFDAALSPVGGFQPS
jgi:hypothetical protein